MSTDAFTSLLSRLEMNQAAFTSLLETRFPWARVRDPGIEAILFNLFRKTAVVPFQSRTPPATLDLDAYTRAASILARLGVGGPLGSGEEDSDWVVMRRRTKEDDYRVLFQGLSSADLASPTTEPGTALSLEAQPENKFAYIDVSAEDPYVTDLADVLTTTTQVVEMRPDKISR